MKKFDRTRRMRGIGIASWLSCVLFIPSIGLAAQPTAAEIADGVEKHIEDYRNLKFEYTVEAKFWPAPELQLGPDGKPLPSEKPKGEIKIVNSKDIFKILDPNQKDISKPWRFWQRSAEDDNGQWAIDRFIAFDGEQSAGFERRDHRAFNHGSIVPFEETHEYDPNVFDRILCTNLNGIQKYHDPNWELSAKVDKHWKVVGSREFEGRKVYVLQGGLPMSGLEFEVHVTAPPDFIIIRREQRLTNSPDDEPLLLMEVTKIGEFESLVYPASGRYVRRAIGYAPRVDYEFEVTSVETLTDAAREDWRPEWPLETAVRDQVNKRNFMTPRLDLIPAQ